jgi:myo-inositol-1(or 4)-monophosphatase
LGKQTSPVNDFAELLPIANEAVDLAHELFLNLAPGHLTAKGDRDMASEVDYAIERKLAEFLRAKTPHIGFLGEEDGTRGVPSELVWTLDPYRRDRQLPPRQPAVRHLSRCDARGHPRPRRRRLPRLGSRYTAVQGHGAYAGDRRLCVRATEDLSDAVVAIGDYAVGAEAEDRNKIRLAITAKLAATVQRVRMHGSAAIDLAWVAEGRIDGMIMMSNKPLGHRRRRHHRQRSRR